MHPVHQKNMNGYGDDTNSSCCYFHPKEVVIGVCPLCLNERLLFLASKRGASHRSKVVSDKKQPNTSNLPKIFALGSLLNRFEFRHWKSDQHDACSSSSSQEDSFISIKFEDNGVASWEKGRVSLEHCSKSWNSISMAKEPIPKENKSVIEHAKQKLRWRKRIGHLLQLVRWKARSNNRGNVDGVKVRKGWIRILAKIGGPKNKATV